MASFTPPLYNSDVFNPSLFDYASESLTLDTADKRYLKLTGGSITGNLFVSGVVDCGTLTIGGSPVDLSYITGITPGTAVASKALVLDSSSNITGINLISSTSLMGTTLTLSGASMTSTQINYLTSITPGTAAASKAIILDASSNITGINFLSATRIGVNNTSSSYPIDCGSISSDRILSLYSNASQFYGFGASGSYLKHQSYSGHQFYYLSSNSSTGTLKCTINVDGMQVIGTTSSTDLYSTGDIISASGDYVMDDAKSILLCRSIASRDLNSKIWCNGTSNLTLESSRGNGNVSVIANRSGLNSTDPSFAVYDGTFTISTTTFKRAGFLVFGYRRNVLIGDWSDTTSGPTSDIGIQVNVQKTIETNGAFNVDNVASSYIRPSYVWDVAGSQMGSDSSNFAGLGNHDTASGSNRTRIGLVYWNSSGGLNGYYRFDSGGGEIGRAHV